MAALRRMTPSLRHPKHHLFCQRSASPITRESSVTDSPLVHLRVPNPSGYRLSTFSVSLHTRTVSFASDGDTCKNTPVDATASVVPTLPSSISTPSTFNDDPHALAQRRQRERLRAPSSASKLPGHTTSIGFDRD